MYIFLKNVDKINIAIYNGNVNKRKDNMDEVSQSLQNKNLSESEKRVKEIARECGLKRMI